MPVQLTVRAGVVVQYPWAAARATLEAQVVAVGVAAVVALPALSYLYKLTQTEAWSQHGDAQH